MRPRTPAFPPPPAWLLRLRRRLHRFPEAAGTEEATAELVTAELRRRGADAVHVGVGGHGVLAEYHGLTPGPCHVLRAELDAVAVPETGDVPWRSRRPGCSHACGHDGHMAALLGLAAGLARHRPRRGTLALLFQPAEETGEGARRVLEDRRFGGLKPAAIYAFHNLPGEAMGTVLLRRGPVTTASAGLHVVFSGSDAHAAQPETGRSPATVLATLMAELPELPDRVGHLEGPARVTLVHVRLGESPAYGTSPGRGVLALTLRAGSDESLDALLDAARARISHLATDAGLEVAFEVVDRFPATVCTDAAVTAWSRAACAAGLPVTERARPFPWSEDLGHLTAAFGGALVCLGAGVDRPLLHDGGYDFPDELLGPAVALLQGLARVLTSPEDES